MKKLSLLIILIIAACDPRDSKIDEYEKDPTSYHCDSWEERNAVEEEAKMCIKAAYYYQGDCFKIAIVNNCSKTLEVKINN